MGRLDAVAVAAVDRQECVQHEIQLWSMILQMLMKVLRSS
jgi:hypothetical protein